MPPDIRALVQGAAPRPAAEADVSAIRRRARRIALVRVVAAVVATLAVGTGSVVAASLADRATEDVVGDPRPRPAPPEPEVDFHEGEDRIPPGPRYEVASGAFGGDWDYGRGGERWRLLVWGRGGTRCWQFAQGEAKAHEGVACTHEPGRPEAFHGMMSFATGSRDPAEYEFVTGELAPPVRRLVFRGDRGPDFSIPVHRPPRRSGVAHGYYAALLPRYDYARLVALDGDGDVLARRALCGIGCKARRAVAATAEVRQYERTPVSVESAAAAFAIEAAARAGVIDQLGTYWIYRTISGEDLVATFDTTDCSAAVPDGGYRCDRSHGEGTVDVGVEDGRFVVERVEGSMTGAQRAALESFSAPVTDDVREWRHVAHSFARTEGGSWEAAFVMVWTGNMGAPSDYGSACRYTVYDSRGDVLHRSRMLPFEVRNDEYFRAGGLVTEGRDRARPDDLVVECDEPGPELLDRTYWGG